MCPFIVTFNAFGTYIIICVRRLQHPVYLCIFCIELHFRSTYFGLYCHFLNASIQNTIKIKHAETGRLNEFLSLFILTAQFYNLQQQKNIIWGQAYTSHYKLTCPFYVDIYGLHTRRSHYLVDTVEKQIPKKSPLCQDNNRSKPLFSILIKQVLGLWTLHKLTKCTTYLTYFFFT